MPEARGGTDAYLYRFTNSCAKKLCGTPISPNFVTTLGLITSFFVARNIAEGGAIGTCILLAFVMSILDLLDGSIARVCSKQTKFGAKYDVSSDAVKCLLISVAIIWRSKRVGPNFVHALLIMFSLLASIRMIFMSIFENDESTPAYWFIHDNTTALIVASVIFVKLLLKKQKTPL